MTIKKLTLYLGAAGTFAMVYGYTGSFLTRTIPGKHWWNSDQVVRLLSDAQASMIFNLGAAIITVTFIALLMEHFCAPKEQAIDKKAEKAKTSMFSGILPKDVKEAEVIEK